MLSTDAVITLTICMPCQENGLSKIDLELAWCHQLLEAAYQNDHDVGYTYIDKAGMGNSFPLIPFMMKEWARAIVCVLFPLS